MPLITPSRNVSSQAQLADNVVGTEQIIDDDIGVADIGTDAVGADELADNAVDQAAIGDDAVDLAELKARTQGEIIFYGASGVPSVLSAGTSGKFLKTVGPGNDPIWDDAPVELAPAVYPPGFESDGVLGYTISGTLEMSLADGVTKYITAIFTVPKGATTISDIQMIANANVSANIALTWETRNFPYSQASTRTIDTTDTLSAYATGTSGNKLTLISAPAAAYNLHSVAEGDILFVKMIRTGGDASDTYNQAVQVYAIKVTFT